MDFLKLRVNHKLWNERNSLEKSMVPVAPRGIFLVPARKIPKKPFSGGKRELPLATAFPLRIPQPRVLQLQIKISVQRGVQRADRT